MKISRSQKSNIFVRLTKQNSWKQFYCEKCPAFFPGNKGQFFGFCSFRFCSYSIESWKKKKRNTKQGKKFACQFHECCNIRSEMNEWMIFFFVHVYLRVACYSSLLAFPQPSQWQIIPPGQTSQPSNIPPGSGYTLNPLTPCSTRLNSVRHGQQPNQFSVFYCLFFARGTHLRIYISRAGEMEVVSVSKNYKFTACGVGDAHFLSILSSANRKLRWHRKNTRPIYMYGLWWHQESIRKRLRKFPTTTIKELY